MSCLLIRKQGAKRRESIKDAVVVVTGAASGIGAAICKTFGKKGAKIVLLDMDKEGVEATKQELVEQGIDAVAQRCDVTDAVQCQERIEEVIRRYGGIDVLANNAGITQGGPFLEADMPMYRKVMDVNFFGALHCSKAAIESLIKRKGLIIVTSSIAGLAPVLGRTGYCASKHALHGLFCTLRAELKQYGVHVMIVCPGFTKTNLQTRALDGDGTPTSHSQSRVGRQALPEDVADAIYRGALKRKNLIVLTPVGKASYFLYKFTPALYERTMAKLLNKELER